MAADLQMACSVGPPTASDTSIPHRPMQCRWGLCPHFGLTNRNWLYQQKGKTFAIRQFNDHVPPLSTRLGVFSGTGQVFPQH